jgi:cob(I)alamin adenosyltransferase
MFFFVLQRRNGKVFKFSISKGVMKVTTKTGDKGTTMFRVGETISKADVRIEFVGTVDELQVAIGGILMPNQELADQLRWVQKKLFDIYSKKVVQEDVDQLEAWQDQFHKDPEITFDWNLTTPKTFPIDLARVTARKLERVYHCLPEEEKHEQTTLFLNRLSDYLWSAGRKIESVPKKDLQEF